MFTDIYRNKRTVIASEIICLRQPEVTPILVKSREISRPTLSLASPFPEASPEDDAISANR